MSAKGEISRSSAATSDRLTPGVAIRAAGSETALLAAQAAAAALGPRNAAAWRLLVERGGVVAERGRAAGRTVLGHVDPQATPVELLAVEARDRLLRAFRRRELDEGETSRTTGRPVRGNDDLADLTGLGEQGLNVLTRGIETQIAYKDSIADDSLLFLSPVYQRLEPPP